MSTDTNRRIQLMLDEMGIGAFSSASHVDNELAGPAIDIVACHSPIPGMRVAFELRRKKIFDCATNPAVAIQEPVECARRRHGVLRCLAPPRPDGDWGHEAAAMSATGGLAIEPQFAVELGQHVFQ
jgi:hypothetical protein